MEIVLHKSLRDFLQTHGKKDILIYQVSYESCGGPIKDVGARFVEDKDRQRINTAGYTSQDYDFGRIYYLPNTLYFKQQLKFRLFQLFGKPWLKLSGVAPIYTNPWGSD